MTTTLVDTVPLHDGGRMEVRHEGEVQHPKVKTPWRIVRHYLYSEAGALTSTSTYLAGPRGGFYYLRPYLGDDTGARQMVSMKSGGDFRVKGNAVKVIEVAGIIEFLK